MTDDVKRYYSALRDQHRIEHQKRLAACSAQNPRFASFDEERGRVVQQLAQGKTTADAARSRVAAITAERQNLLLSMGLPVDYLEPIFTCKQCKDTGEVGDLLKKPCACQLKKLQEARTVSARINTRETFEAFNADIYGSERQKQFCIRLKAFCLRYVESLPHPQKPTLVLTGQAGLGKSFFGNAIAYAALQRGVDARKVTTYRLLQDVLDGFSSHTEAVATYADVPLLVLDDLGSEPMIPNITVESLFRVLNERFSAMLPTVILTNLNQSDIFEQYGERVASRIFDGGLTQVVEMNGENVRVRRS